MILVCTDGEQISETDLERLGESMPEARRDRWRRVRHAATARGMVIGYWLVRVGFRCARIPDTPNWGYASYGKPVLVGTPGHFSLTHTDAVQACVVSRHAIGLDAERASDRVLSVAKMVFTSGEWDWVSKATSPVDAATVIWTRKESLAKWDGSGMSETVLQVDTTDRLPGVTWRTWRVHDHWLSACAAETDSIAYPVFVLVADIVEQAKLIMMEE